MRGEPERLSGRGRAEGRARENAGRQGVLCRPGRGEPARPPARAPTVWPGGPSRMRADSPGDPAPPRLGVCDVCSPKPAHGRPRSRAVSHLVNDTIRNAASAGFRRQRAAPRRRPWGGARPRPAEPGPQGTGPQGTGPRGPGPRGTGPRGRRGRVRPPGASPPACARRRSVIRDHEMARGERKGTRAAPGRSVGRGRGEARLP